VINPRSDLKNLVWSDSGSTLRISLTPARGQTLEDLSHFRFYLAGELANLALTGLKAYDVDGRPVTDIAAQFR